MTYAIIGTGPVGAALARFFAANTIPVLIANSRGPETLGSLTAELGASVTAVTVEQAVQADIVLVAVGAVAFKQIGAMLHDWSGKIVVDATNGFMLAPEVQQAEYQGRLTSEVNAERVPGAKLVKAFNQLPVRVLAAPLPDDIGRRVVFVSSDHVGCECGCCRPCGKHWLRSDRTRQDRRGWPPHSGPGASRLSEPDQIPDVGW